MDSVVDQVVHQLLEGFNVNGLVGVEWSEDRDDHASNLGV